MRLKGRVTRFSEFAGSGLVITKAGMVSFSCVTRVDSGRDPMEDDVLYIEIPNPEEGELEAIVEAVAWARSQEALEVALSLRKSQIPRKAASGSVSAMQHYEKSIPPTGEEMNEEARYFWYLQTITGAAALQELDSISTDELKEIMAHIAAFEAKYPEKADLIRRRVEKVVASF
jgi:hypothetical protein